MAEEENAFDSLFNFGKKKTNPPVLPKKPSKKKKKMPKDKIKSKEPEHPPYQKDNSNQALKTGNENEISLKKAESTEKVTSDPKKPSANGHESESEIDDILVEILVAAAHRRAEPLSAQNMAVDLYGKTPLPTRERPDN